MFSRYFPGFVKLKVYDILGKEVAILVNKYQNAGSYTIKFDASSLPSGIYLYRLEAGSFIETRKLILIK
ncbi:MAG: T9SS type A sorting domain-containing protein [Bacteroidota bacterium]|nr:T9SS type A sorting domain-containing protein [Bacteroidota bacterium]MDP4193088.1 T9SS type A sorting domain-containing protein [Bacteroidota bacterium]